MSSRFGESTSSNTNGNTIPNPNPNPKESSGSFECNICLELAQEPIITLCGHLFCWPCLYEWLHIHAHSPECPVCKALIEEEKLVPLYGRGKVREDPRTRSREIPSRPTGQRPQQAEQFGNGGNWYMGGPGAGAVGGGPGVHGPGAGGPGPAGRWGNYTFSAAIGGLFPLLSFQVHGFPHAAAYGPAAGFPYGYGHSLHGWQHAHGFPRQAGGPGGAHTHHHHHHQADAYLKALLVLVGVLVVASLLAF
ncbi:hypothetical protein LUZ60_001539 [Juncus effusus]|nr:hypothetical protein LUZ60_001539 [Juncus effusus]